MFVQDQLSENSKYVDFFSLRSILEAKAFYSPQQSWGLFLRLSKSIRKKGHLPVPLYDRLGRQAVDAFAAAFLQSTSNYEKRLAELHSLITETLPTRMTLDEQSAFQIRYYHETQNRYDFVTLFDVENGNPIGRESIVESQRPAGKCQSGEHVKKQPLYREDMRSVLDTRFDIDPVKKGFDRLAHGTHIR